MFMPIPVQLTVVAQVNTEEKFTGKWWHIITDDKNPLIKTYNIPVSEVDFSTCNLIISGGKEISKMTYTRASKYETDYKEPYIGRAVCKKELYENTIFVYKIKKIQLISKDEAFQ